MRKQILIFILLGCFAWNIQAAQRTVVPTHVTTSYTTKSTARQVTIFFTSTFTGTVNGVSFNYAAGGSYTWSAPQTGDTLAPIAIVVTAGAAEVTELQ